MRGATCGAAILATTGRKIQQRLNLRADGPIIEGTIASSRELQETFMDKRIRAALFCAALLLAGCTAPATLAQAPFRPGGGPLSFAPLVKRVVPAVVNISVI